MNRFRAAIPEGSSGLSQKLLLQSDDHGKRFYSKGFKKPGLGWSLELKSKTHAFGPEIFRLESSGGAR